MTTRERTAVVFVAVGVCLVLVGAYAYDGARAVAVVAGALLLVLGVLLALDESPAPLPPELLEEDDGHLPPGSYPNPQDH